MGSASPALMPAVWRRGGGCAKRIGSSSSGEKIHNRCKTELVASPESEGGRRREREEGKGGGGSYLVRVSPSAVGRTCESLVFALLRTSVGGGL